MKVQLDLSTYATKTDLKYAIGIDKLKFAKKVDLASLKCDVDKLDFDELKNLPTNFSNLKSKTDKLDVDKLVPVPVDLKKLRDVVKHYGVKKGVYNTKIENIEDKIPGIANVATNSSLNANNYKLTLEHFTARLKQANLEIKNYIANFVKKTERQIFDYKLKIFSSNKNELNEL